MDQWPLQLEAGEIMELPLLAMLVLVSVLAVDLTDELGDKPLFGRAGFGAAGLETGLVTGRRPPWSPAVASCKVGLTGEALTATALASCGGYTIVDGGRASGNACHWVKASLDSIVESSSGSDGTVGIVSIWGLMTSAGPGRGGC
jgi:hypothetical protein